VLSALRSGNFALRRVLSLIASAAVKLFGSRLTILFPVVAAMLSAPLPYEDEDGDDAEDEQEAHQDENEEKLSVGSRHA
jgi:hypothetical protein